MDSSRPIDRATHTSVLMSAVTLKRNDLVNIAIRHLHNPPGQSVDLSMVDDALLQEYNQLVQANIEAPEPYLERSSRDSSPVMSIRSGSSASSKSSQASFDPRDVFDQVLNSMIERLNLVMPAIKGTRFNRLIGKDRSRRTSLVACLRRFRDDRLNSHFGMSDGARRLKFGSSGFSKEYLRCRDTSYTEILDIQDQLFRICEDENIRRKETLREDQDTAIRAKLEIWGARLTVMTEQMWNAPFIDDNTTPEAQTLDIMDIDEP